MFPSFLPLLPSFTCIFLSHFLSVVGLASCTRLLVDEGEHCRIPVLCSRVNGLLIKDQRASKRVRLNNSELHTPPRTVPAEVSQPKRTLNAFYI